MTDAQLISSILSVYALTRDDISSLAKSIMHSRLNVAQASYKRAQKTIGLQPNYTITKALERKIERQSVKYAQSIAETYQSLLRTFLETLLHVHKSWSDVFGNIREAVSQMVSDIGEWLSDFLPWKSKQVANVTCGGGLNDGIDAFILDWQNGDIIDTETGEVIDMGDYSIHILPGTSSSDACQEWAGGVYDIQSADTLPELPMHPFCIHYKIIELA